MSGTATDFHAGRKVGKYEILTLLSMGGMAELFLAYTAGPGGFRKFVALKQILPDIKKDESFVKMFLDEARITAAFSHSNIGQVFELGEEQGELYLAMEFISGQNLEQVVRSARKGQVEIPIGFAAMAVRDTCLGLHYAHHFVEPSGKPAPVIHRDVSPKNVMVTYDGHVKVIDFGIAKAKGRLNRTQAGMVKGTTGYMSPEQVRNEQLDGRSDLFSAAVMLHELLVGQRLFDGPTDAATMIQIVEGDIAPPRALNPKVPEALSQVVMKALSREREQRYATGKEFARAIDAAMAGGSFDEDGASEFMQGLFAEKVQKTRSLLELASRDDGELEKFAEKLRDEAPDAAGGREGKAAAKPKPSTPGAREGVARTPPGRESSAGRESSGGRDGSVGRESSSGREGGVGRESSSGREGSVGRESSSGREGNAGRDSAGGRDGGHGRDVSVGRESSPGRGVGRQSSAGRTPSPRAGASSSADGRDPLRESQRLPRPAPRSAPAVTDEVPVTSATPAPRPGRTPPGRRPPARSSAPPDLEVETASGVESDDDDRTPNPKARFQSSVAQSYALYSDQEDETAQTGGVTGPKRPVNTSVRPALDRGARAGDGTRRWYSASGFWVFLLVLVGGAAFGTTKLDSRLGELVRPHYLKAEAWVQQEFGEEPPPPAMTALRPQKPKGPPPPQAAALLGASSDGSNGVGDPEMPGVTGAAPGTGSAAGPGVAGARSPSGAEAGAGAAAAVGSIGAGSNAAGSSPGSGAKTSAASGASGAGSSVASGTAAAGGMNSGTASGSRPSGAGAGTASTGKTSAATAVGASDGREPSGTSGAASARISGGGKSATAASGAKAASGSGADESATTARDADEVEVLDTRNSSAAAEDGVGWLTLYTVPPAYVYDGATQLGTTPLVKVPLPAGTYRLRLMDSDSKYRTLSAPIKPGKVTDMKIRVSDLPLDPSQD